MGRRQQYRRSGYRDYNAAMKSVKVEKIEACIPVPIGVLQVTIC